MSTKKFVFRVFAYKEADETYTAVCLDLDIVEENHQSLQQAVISINEAIESHLKAAKKLCFPKELLYRPAPKAYWKKLTELASPSQPTITPFQYFTTPNGRGQIYA